MAKEELDAKCAEVSQLKGDLSKLALEEEAFKDDFKDCIYTGLPTWDLLLKLFGYLRPHLGSAKHRLSPFQQVIMTLMRLWLNLSIQDPAFHFKIHKSTISCTFSETMSTMYFCLRLIYCQIEMLF